MKCKEILQYLNQTKFLNIKLITKQYNKKVQTQPENAT